MDNKKVDKEKSYAGITKLMLILRAVAAGYILYIAYTLLDSYLKGEGLPLYLLIICLVVFVSIAGVILVYTIKALIKGEYAGGKMDKSAADNMKDTIIEEVKDELDSMETDAMETGSIETDSTGTEQESLADRLKKYNNTDGNT